MQGGRTIVGAAFLAMGIGAPSVSVPPLPPLPQPIQGLLSPSPASNGQTAQSSSSGLNVVAVSAFAQSIVAELNQARTERGLRPLRLSSVLTTASIAHATALAMSGQFTHSWPGRTSVPDLDPHLLLRPWVPNVERRRKPVVVDARDRCGDRRCTLACEPDASSHPAEAVLA
jgi:hypothetical protein